ncbi:MAG TPA: hypothetical protein DEP69_02775 [Acidimicrobiaceae bacterium]|nr:hypothetical protein [Acidimicrobiaceae bacterium]
MPPSDTPADIPSVALGDGDVVLRRVPIDEAHVKARATPSGSVFRPRAMSRPDLERGCSVASRDLLTGRGGTIAQFAAAVDDPTDQAVAALRVADVRRHGFDVVHRPIGHDAVGYAHAEIVIPEDASFAIRAARNQLLKDASVVHGADELRDFLSEIRDDR